MDGGAAEHSAGDMKILITNPDTMGDFVLRQPLFAELSAAGHELLLVTRSAVSPLAPYAAPGARVVHCPLNPYEPNFPKHLGELESLVNTCRDFAPNRIVVAPYQRTLLDEYLVECLPDTPSIGMNGYLFRGSPAAGLDQSSSLKLSQEAAVSEDDLEIRKNEALCAAVLGRNVTLPPPAIEATEESREHAFSLLRKLGFNAERVWVACAGHSQWTAIRNWNLENWSQTLSRICERHEIEIVFPETRDEDEATEAIRRGMGAMRDRTVNLCSSPLSLPQLIGLLSVSAGYLGRDTGPMHLAAALGKPVVAVFGGGTWPRFIPAARNGCAVTVEVPCSGCDWHCHLSDSFCVKTVSEEAVLKGFARTASESGPFRVQREEASEWLLRKMIADAWATADLRTRESNRQIAGLSSRTSALEAALDAERRGVSEQRAALQRLTRQVEDLRRLAGTSEEKLSQREFELENVRQDSETNRAESERLRDLIGLLKKEHSKLGEEYAGLQEDLSSARQELEILNANRRVLEARYADASAKLDSIRQSIFAKLLSALRIWRVFD